MFLQTGFRTGGTWLWSRFRQCPEVLALCEPLNEALESITPEAISGLTSLASSLNHPTLEAPYFQEFSAFIGAETAGVRHYRAEFGLQTYFDPPEEQPRELAHYLSQILAYAEQRGKQPVLKFTRALGRADWLRRTFPSARQILLVRDPWHAIPIRLGAGQAAPELHFLDDPSLCSQSSADRCTPISLRPTRYSVCSVHEGIAKPAGTYTELAQQLSSQGVVWSLPGNVYCIAF